MAVGADTRLNGFGRSPLAAARPAPMQQTASTPSYGPRPPMVSDSAVQGSVNNIMAGSDGTARGALLEQDRGGVSRGRGQQYASQIAEAGANMQGRASAAQVEMGAAGANASANNAYDYAMQQEKIGNGGLLENLRNQNALARTQRQGYAQDMYEANRRGQFGMDQIAPNYSPIWDSLFR
jgi:hypothetical protein